MSRILLVALLFGCLTGIGVADNKTPQKILQGEVHVASTDEKGNILTVEILVGEGANQEPYLVADGAKANELKKMVGQVVVVGGTVSEDKLGWKTINVRTFTQADFQFPDR